MPAGTIKSGKPLSLARFVGESVGAGRPSGLMYWAGRGDVIGSMTTAPSFLSVDGGLDDLVGAGILSHEVSRNPDARAFERTRLQVLRVIALEFPLALLRRIVGRIDAGHDPQRHRHIVDATRHRPTRVERERQRHDACATEEPVRRLQTDNSVG